MRYFTIEELTRSATAEAQHIDNTPNAEHIANLQRLTERVLDPLREAYGAPIYVNSGYRCPALNRAVGGVANSYHLHGCAADITAGSKEANRRLYALAQNLPCHQLINERNFSWLHVAIIRDA